MKPSLEQICQVPDLDRLAAADAAKLLEIADLLRLGADEPVLEPGQVPSEVYFVLSGYVAGTYPRSGRELATEIFGPGDMIGVGALDGSASPLGARTATAAHLIALRAAELRVAMESDPALGAAFLRAAVRTTHRLLAQSAALKTQSAAQRLADFLLELAHGHTTDPVRFVLPYAKQMVAIKIGCSQENLSRAFASLRQAGVETRNGVVVIRDVGKLGALAAE